MPKRFIGIVLTRHPQIFILAIEPLASVTRSVLSGKGAIRTE